MRPAAQSGAQPGALPTPARLAAALGGRLPPPGARIGLLGGSFNPAHDGHRDISLAALRRLGLDEVWWLVSPQNPLKPEAGMAPHQDRVARAAAVAGHPRIRVTGLEAALGTIYTADSLRALAQRFPRVRFVWLIGADNLVQIEHWQDWPQIFHAVVIAVFDRPSYSLRASVAKAARRFTYRRLMENKARRLTAKPPPAWVFLHTRLNALSGSRIRTGRRAGCTPG